MCAFPASSWPRPKPKKEASATIPSATRVRATASHSSRAPVDLVRLEVRAEGGEVDGQRGDLEDWDAEERRRRHQHVQRVLAGHADRVLLVRLGRDARRHHAALELIPLPGDRRRRDADGPRTERDDAERVEEGGAVGAGGAGREGAEVGAEREDARGEEERAEDDAVRRSLVGDEGGHRAGPLVIERLHHRHLLGLRRAGVVARHRDEAGLVLDDAERAREAVEVARPLHRREREQPRHPDVEPLALVQRLRGAESGPRVAGFGRRRRR